MRLWQLLLLMVSLLVALLTISFPYIDIESKDPRFKYERSDTDPNDPDSGDNHRIRIN